jgi:putative redox protein
MVGLRLILDASFPDGDDGDRAREVLPRAMQQSHDRICTVSRTIEHGEPLEFVEA